MLIGTIIIVIVVVAFDDDIRNRGLRRDLRNRRGVPVGERMAGGGRGRPAAADGTSRNAGWKRVTQPSR